MDLLARSCAVVQLRRTIQGMLQHDELLTTAGDSLQAELQLLIPVGRVDQHQAVDLLRELSSEISHVQAAQRMPDEDITEAILLCASAPRAALRRWLQHPGHRPPYRYPDNRRDCRR